MPKTRTVLNYTMGAQVRVSSESRGLRDMRTRYVCPSDIEAIGDMDITNTLYCAMLNPGRDFVVGSRS